MSDVLRFVCMADSCPLHLYRVLKNGSIGVSPLDFINFCVSCEYLRIELVHGSTKKEIEEKETEEVGR